MSAVKVKVKIRRIMRFQSPVQDFSRAAADLMYSSQWCFLNHTYIIFPHCHLMLYEHKCTVKDELFRNPRSRKVSACYFEQPIFSNISKMMHFICLQFVLGQNTAGFIDVSLYLLYTEPDICPVQAEPSPSGGTRWVGASLVLSVCPLSLISHFQHVSYWICATAHMIVFLLSGNSCFEAQRKVKRFKIFGKLYFLMRVNYDMGHGVLPTMTSSIKTQ